MSDSGGSRILSAAAPAKINLVLEILGRRPDGYHELDTILQTLDLSDRVSLDFEAERAGVSVDGPFRDGVPADETNLAWRAAAGLAARCGFSVACLHIHLEKHIPAAGGLGGGASDAATVLRLLQSRHPEIPDPDLFAVAEGIGSDEAAFLLGGTSRAQGRGERVSSVGALPRLGVLLFVSAETLPRKTAALFEAFSRSGNWGDGRHSNAFDAFVQESRSAPSALLHNDFEQVAFDLFPGLGALRLSIQVALGVPIQLAGAGPTLYWLGPEALLPEMERRARAARPNCTIIPTATATSLWKQ